MALEGDRVETRATSAGAVLRWPRVWMAVVALSVVPRLVHLDVPPLDRHDFRQTQTAITVQAFLDRGVDVLHYQTPVLGPPWTVPFEFPLFQLSAFAVARLTAFDVDLACRLTAVLWFYASAWILYALVRHWTTPRLAVLSLLLYVLSPFSLLWSRAVLIDYAAVALLLGYFHATLLWGIDGRRWAWLAAVVLGSLGILTKITTAATVAVPVALALGWRLRRARETRRSDGGGHALGVGLVAVLIAGVPLVSGVLWTRWTDAIKAAQPATASLTSQALTTWNFGNWGQRASLLSWGEILGRIAATILPAAFAPTLLLAIPFFRRADRRLKIAGWMALTGVLTPILVFFNLYRVHDYYLIAVAPFLAFLGAAGIAFLLERPAWHRTRVRTLVLGVALLSTIPCWTYAAPTYQVSRDTPLARLGRLIAGATTPGDWVVVQGDEWNSRILYASRRRGFMIWEGRTDVRPLTSRPELGALVCKECTPELLALFPRRRLVGSEASYDVYRLWPESGQPR
jgi:4-amino-4-deoxy-L-arabinose transferase-like glycosyltransferase